jgi:pimeloyl-ACP methyl ester carboxylesterase
MKRIKLVLNRVKPIRVLAASGFLIAIALPAVGNAVRRDDHYEKHPHTPVPQLAWRDCGDGVQCAEAMLPLDHDQPKGDLISVALARRPATDQAHRIGTLFVNNGGPGNSVVDFVRGDAVDVLPADVQARFDVVGFDPRGVGESTPLRCFSSAEEQAEFVSSRPGYPIGAAEIAAFTSSSAEIGRKCAEARQPILSHMSTANVARDLDLLRQAVGDHALNFAGYSYGGLLGATYAAMFPDTIRAMVLDGVADPSEWTRADRVAKTQPVTTRLHSARATGAALESFLELCQQAGNACSFGSSDPGVDASDKFDRLLDRLHEGTVEIDGPDGSIPVTEAFVLDSMRGGLQFPPAWAFMSDQLQMVFDSAFPDGSPFVPANADAGDEPLEPPQAYDNSFESMLAVLCSESTNPTDPEAWIDADAAARADDGYFGPDWTWLSQPCATWPVHDKDAYLGPFESAPTAPLLFLNSVADAASDYEAVDEIASGFDGSSILTLEGPGHPASFMNNSCVDASISAYLIDVVPLVNGSVCPSEVQPFQ